METIVREGDRLSATEINQFCAKCVCQPQNKEKDFVNLQTNRPALFTGIYYLQFCPDMTETLITEEEAIISKL